MKHDLHTVGEGSCLRATPVSVKFCELCNAYFMMARLYVMFGFNFALLYLRCREWAVPAFVQTSVRPSLLLNEEMVAFA